MPDLATRLRQLSALLLTVGLAGAALTLFQPAPAQAQSVLERLFGRPTAEHQRRIGRPARTETTRGTVRKRVVRRTTRSASHSGSGASARAASGYTYRTLCVRKADGYFFPISFSTTETHFDEDLQKCRARCEGTDVDLYVHKVLREEAEQMVSHSTGENYTAMPTAFSYRRSGLDPVAAKACEPTLPLRGGTIAADLGEMPFEAQIPMPMERPDHGAILVSDLAGEAASMELIGPKFIRRVGPRFFPDR